MFQSLQIFSTQDLIRTKKKPIKQIYYYIVPSHFSYQSRTIDVISTLEYDIGKFSSHHKTTNKQHLHTLANPFLTLHYYPSKSKTVMLMLSNLIKQLRLGMAVLHIILNFPNRLQESRIKLRVKLCSNNPGKNHASKRSRTEPKSIGMAKNAKSFAVYSTLLAAVVGLHINKIGFDRY